MIILIKNIGDSLDDLGYPDLNQLENYLADLNTVHFSKLVHWLSSNLGQVSSVESSVNEITSEQEADSFAIELSSLLKELGSPHDVGQLNDLTGKLTILNYLCGELLVASIDFVKRANQPGDQFDESEIAKQLRLILMSLGISKPPPNITVKQLFDKITECVDAEFKRRKIPIEESLLIKDVKQRDQIGPAVWATLDEVNEQLQQEYEIRRRTLITRSDCTCASFKWKKECQNEELERKISEMYAKFNYLLERDIDIEIANLMAVKTTDFNQLNNLVISKSHQSCSFVPTDGKLANQGLQQRLNLHKFLIGQVPDRGGRTQEAIKPELETFSQQQQQRQQQAQRSNRGGFNQGASQNRQNFHLNPNRVQGSGWNQQDKNSWGNRNFTSPQSGGDRHYGNNANKYQQQRGGGNYYQQGDQLDQYDNGGNYDGAYQQQRGGNQQRGGQYRQRNDGGGQYNRGRRGGRY